MLLGTAISDYRKLKAQEIVTLYNYVWEWNYGGEVNDGHPSDIVAIEFPSGNMLGLYPLSSYSIKKEDITEPAKKMPIEEFLLAYPENEYYFNCTNLEYRESDGRIKSLKIKCIRKP